jgi:hypothetical protein
LPIANWQPTDIIAMRRPRSKLEVSTFPFLAVLLCAMGALLLLLFIMDRRAKIASRNNAMEQMEARKARTQTEEETRVAEWEKAKEKLHALLLEQQNQVLADSSDTVKNLSDAGNKLVIIQAQNLELDKQVKEENDKIASIQIQIASQRASLQQADKKESASKTELLEAAKELAELEAAFLLLRAQKEREKQIYSVVPYRGKRGDMRPPIYVECVQEGVVFHPAPFAGRSSAGPVLLRPPSRSAARCRTRKNLTCYFLFGRRGSRTITRRKTRCVATSSISAMS